MGTEIRPFGIGDYSAALSLWESTKGVGLSDADSRQGIAQFLGRNPGLSLVALSNGQLIATMLCGHDGRRGFIHHLVVSPSHRSIGLGRRMVKLGLVALREQGIDKCHLLVFRQNEKGAEFWSSVGAEERTSLVLFSLPTHAGGANPSYMDSYQ